MKMELADRMSGLGPGSHLCLFYEQDPAEQMPALVPFIRDGLAGDERFIYIADDQTVEELAEHLEQDGIDVAGETRSGRLKLFTRAEWRQPGRLDSQSKARQVRQFAAEAARAGFKGIRFAVEMTWTLGPKIEVHDLEHWEATLNTLFEPSFPSRIVCQYNRSRLAPEVLIAALHTHPEAIFGNAIYPNPFYAAPFILNGNGHGNGDLTNGKLARARLDWMQAQIERARKVELDHQELCRERAARAEAEASKRRAEASEQRLRAFLEQCPECVKVLRPAGTVVEMNAAGLRMVEADSPDRVVGKSVFELIAPEDRARFEAMHERVCHGTTAGLEFEIVGLKGTRRRVETHAAPLSDPQTAGFLHVAVTRDITERKRAETIKNRLSAIVESSDDAIVSKDLNGVIMTWNAGAERIFGYTAQEAIGCSVTMLLPEERHDEEPEILSRIRRGERIDHYETVRRRKDGRFVDISLTVSPIRDAGGQVIGASKIARDITVRKRAEAELRATRDQLGRLNEELEERVRERTASLTEAITQMEEFSYTVSHDLRAPARSMRCYAKIVLEDFGEHLDAEAKGYLERIMRGGERMDTLIRDVLTYTRIGRRQLELVPVCLDKLLSDLIQQYPEMQAPRAFVTIRSPLLEVRAHEPSLAQAISNLLTNAIKFMPPREVPRITVSTEPRASRVRLWIEERHRHQARISAPHLRNVRTIANQYPLRGHGRWLGHCPESGGKNGRLSRSRV